MRNRITPVVVVALTALMLVPTGGEDRSARGEAVDPAARLEDSTEGTRRVGGADRIASAVVVAQAAHPSGAEHVVLATAGRYADALAGSALAGAEGGPVLLTGGVTLEAAVADELARLDPTAVTVLGGPRVVSPRVVEEIGALGVTVRRLDGRTRFETAAEVARELGGRGGHAFLVEGQHAHPGRGWPDAVAVSALAARERDPVLLTLAGELPGTTAGVIRELGLTEVTIVGGTAAVSAGVAQSVADLGVTVRRVAGATRYATSVALLSRSAEAGLSPGRPWVVTGRDWPDALAAGPAAARDGDALLLVDGTDLDRSRAAQRWLLRSWPKERATLVGGTSAVGRGTERDLAALIADRARTGTRVAAAGDIACDPRDAKWGAHDACRQADTAELAGRAQAVLALGDLQYARATSANFAASYDPTWGRFKGVTHPALGSHEYAAGSRAADYHAYFDGRVGEPGRAYYETTLGGWQVLSLDSSCHEHNGCGDGSAMQRWLERRLADSAASCQLAMMHHPPFSSGSVHGSHPHLRPLLETLQAGGVDVLLTSHAHSYERLRRATPAGAPDPDRGIRSFVVGTGGKDLRALSPSPHPLTAIRTHQHFGVLELDLRPTSYRWEFQPLADSGHGGGSFTDVGFGSCR